MTLNRVESGEIFQTASSFLFCSPVKLMITESQFHFANISATKAGIFMKFYMVVSYYVVSLSFKFYDDPCTNARARVINARNRNKTCAGALTTRARAFMHQSA